MQRFRLLKIFVATLGFVLGMPLQTQALIYNKLQESLPQEWPMKIESSAFKHNERIPPLYTCDGKNINPPLVFSDVPPKARSLALINDDPDAPVGTWDHWLLWNMAPDVSGITENSVPSGSIEGVQSWGRTGYGGPCPPAGTHRYFFKLYALDTMLTLDKRGNKSALLSAMQGHIIAQAELIGLYSRIKNR
jgi:Raf kinase inhibitor-like YbhB/YbcL family protein